MPGLSPYKRVLTAGQRQIINVRGSTCFLRLAESAIRVSLRSNAVGTKSGVEYSVTMEQAEQWLHAEEFDEVAIENLDLVNSNAIEFYIGFGRFIKPVPDIVNVQVSSNNNNTATTSQDETNIDIGNAGAVQLLAQDNDRVQAWISALETNAEEIRIGDANVDTDQGTPLQPGDTILWSSKGPCYACSIATNDQGAAVTEFTE